MKRFIALLIILILGVGVLIFTFSRTTVMFDYKNIETIAVTEKGTGKSVGTISNNSSLYLPKDTDLVATYKGVSGYANGTVTFNSSGTMPVKLRPYYSKTKLLELLTLESPQIRNQINAQFPDITTRFTLSKEGLLRYGDWYIALYKYKGEYSLNSDSLRVVAKKTDGSWKTASSPEIFLNVVSYPDIPKEILQKANDL